MSNKIQAFEHSQFGKIRMIVIDGTPWFYAIDVARALGYKNTNDAIIRYCKKVSDLPNNYRYGDSCTPPATPPKIIPESDVYRLVMHSRLPQAEPFQDWVCGEVLPYIRKNMTCDLALELDLPMLLKRMLEVKEDTTGYIYIANVVDTDFYKIGMTHRQPRERFQDLVNICHSHIFPVELELIASVFVENRFRSENIIHDFYEQKRLHSEWFKLTKDEVHELIYKYFKETDAIKD